MVNFGGKFEIFSYSMLSLNDDPIIAQFEKFFTEEPITLKTTDKSDIVNTTSELLEILSDDQKVMNEKKKLKKQEKHVSRCSLQSAPIKSVRFSVDEEMMSKTVRDRQRIKENNLVLKAENRSRRRVSVESMSSRGQTEPKRVKIFDFLGVLNYALTTDIKYVSCKPLKVEPIPKERVRRKRKYKREIPVAKINKMPDVRNDCFTIRNIVVKKEIIDLTEDISSHYVRINFGVQHMIEWESTDILAAPTFARQTVESCCFGWAATSPAPLIQQHLPVIDLTCDVLQITHEHCAYRIMTPILKYYEYHPVVHQTSAFVQSLQTLLAPEDFETDSKLILLPVNKRIALLGQILVDNLSEVVVKNVDVRKIFLHLQQILKKHHNIVVSDEYLYTVTDEMLKNASNGKKSEFVTNFTSQLSHIIRETYGEEISQEQLQQLQSQICIYKEISITQKRLMLQDLGNFNLDAVKQEVQRFDNESSMPISINERTEVTNKMADTLDRVGVIIKSED